MIRLIWLFLVICAIAVGAAFLADQRDEIVITWAGHEVRMLPAVAIAAVAGLMAVLLVLWRLLGFLFDWPGAMSRWRRDRRRRRGYLALARGMVAVAAGDAKEARRHQAKARKAGQDEPLLSQLLAAQTAQLEGDDDGAARAYADMLGRRETEFLGLRGLFLQALRRGDTDAARRHAARAFALRPQTPWVSTSLFDLEAASGNWTAAEKVLDTQARLRLIPSEAARRKRAVLSAALAQDSMDPDRPELALSRARAALKIDRGLLPAALAASWAYRRIGKTKRANVVLERAWAVQPHPDLAAAYGELNATTPGKHFDRLIALNPSHAESRLLSAAQEAQLGRLNEAEGMLQPLLEPYTPARAARLMADIAIARGDQVGARLWADRAIRAPSEGVWRCTACEHEAGEWAATCPECAAFDTLVWSPPAHPVPAPMIESETTRLLYRLAPPSIAVEVLEPPPRAIEAPPQPRDDEEP